MTRSALDTPMMRQFLEVKAAHPNAVVFYRMGDFYEMFLEDATRCAELLDLTLTTRDRGKADAVPMCGVPVHSAQAYIQRLAQLGHRIAICEQVEDPKAAGKRLVKREVVEVITPGLVGDPEGLVAERELALAAIAWDGEGGEAGLAVFDATTGSFRATSLIASAGQLPRALWEELARVAPRELILERERAGELAGALRESFPDTALTELGPEDFEAATLADPPSGFSPAEGATSRAAAAVLRFVSRNQPSARRQIVRLRNYALSESMVLDPATCTHLELFESQEDRSRRGTLIERIDLSTNALGARCLARWLRYPLLDLGEIAKRQQAVEELFQQDRRRAGLREALAAVRDLERLYAKAARPTSTPRDLGAVRDSLRALPAVCEALAAREDMGLGASHLEAPECVTEVAELLWEGLIDEPPVIPKGSRGALETGYIRSGFRAELDSLRESASKGREWIAGLEAEERQRSGITNMKVRFHPVHGYALEVTKSQLDKVPADYERKQTLANAERFTTPALREMEGKVRGAQERAAALEREIFDGLRETLCGVSREVQSAAAAVAALDALAALAEVARRDAWIRPEMDDSRDLEVEEGRHPVVDSWLRSQGGDAFVPNPTHLAEDEAAMVLLTGPNMSGKSTYLRQVGLLVLLAQMGSFVPAKSARIGLVDRVFTRVGANDRQARGESTFMVEMRETADILAEASDRSLLILDEIGRGTSTFDGLAIAWAVAEYLHDTPGLCPRTLFATHYHELAELAESRPRLCNMHFEVREWEDRVIFLRRLVPGEASRSYGIQVARLAGLPDSILRRANQRLDELSRAEEAASAQLGLFSPQAPRETTPDGLRALARRLAEVEIDTLRPVDALLLLQELQAKLPEDPV